MKVRIKFKKYGPIRFIGHLDVMRYFQKAMRRAEIDIAYTGGYSPHQIMTFAAPLGVGLESNGEYMDIECNSVTSSEDMICRLNRAGVTGLDVISVKALPEHAGNAMASVAAASYTVSFRDGRGPSITILPSTIQDFLAQNEILITKETKTGIHEVNIRPGIYDMHLNDNGSIYLMVDASSAGNLKPAKIMEAFLKHYGEVMQENALWITREDVYTNTGTPVKPVFTSMDEIGSIIPSDGDVSL